MEFYFLLTKNFSPKKCRSGNRVTMIFRFFFFYMLRKNLKCHIFRMKTVDTHQHF
jgi:hypothetical protein